MRPNTTEGRVYQIPPLEIRFSDLDISPKNPHCKNAIKALKSYWAQATVMTKDEQCEYWDLLVTQELYVWKRSNSSSAHRLYRQILRKRGSWPEWVLLASLYDYDPPEDPKRVIAQQFGTSAIEDFTSEYQKYYPTTVPELDDNVEYEGDDYCNDRVYEISYPYGTRLDSDDEDHIQSDSLAKSQGNPKDDETVRDWLLGQSSISAKRPASLDQAGLEKRQRVDNTQTREQ